MRMSLFGILAAFLPIMPLQAQVRGGTLIVLIVSQRSDYVVIGAESRTSDEAGNRIDDRSCKIISLGGDTLFYEGGKSSLDIIGGNSWSAQGAARAAYKYSHKRDALSLTSAWGERASKWFSQLSEKNFLEITEPPKRILVTGGFVTFDKNAALSAHGTELSYNFIQHKLQVRPFSYASGDTGAWGVATDLVLEFFESKTQRAVEALGTAGSVKSRGADSASDINLVKKAIKFAMDNATGKEKAQLGGDIDVAIIRNDHTIQWVARKASCRKQDEKPTPPHK